MKRGNNMDAEHRHELKTNELEDWIKHFPEFCKKNRHQIVGVILIIAAFISYFFFKNTTQQAGLEQQTQTTSQMEKVGMDKGEVINGVMSDSPVVLMGFEDSAKT